jgi:UDP-N-acetylglucosamine--N-acetylmuramyl-(pentapeptide) pyrophosphoryl-undecaprenol N-acetylglucosamine transferase
MINKTIVFTGGGTAGHVLPNFPLIEKFLNDKWKVYYIGSNDGIEKQIIEENFKGKVEYFGITCDKLRRYATYKHFLMPFKLIYGFYEALFLLMKLKPGIIFSKGGFVSVPIVFASYILRKKIVIHESDYSIGLANKMAFPMADLIAVSFDMFLYDKKYHKKMIQIGPLIRSSFLDRKNIINVDFLNKDKKTLLILGGSLGAKNINEVIYRNIDELLYKFNVLHICGKGNLPNFSSEKYKDSYKVFEFLNEGISNLINSSDLIISRAGINSIWEILLMKKPSILIPLSEKKSRGDQVDNANYFKKLGVVDVIQDDDLNFHIMMRKIEEMLENYNFFSKNIEENNFQLGNDELYKKIIDL